MYTVKPFCRTLIALLWCVTLQYASTNSYTVEVSSYLGGSQDGESLYGSAFLSDGTIVLAGIIGDKTVDGKADVLLNGATTASNGAVIRLSADARSIISITRIAEKVVDLAVDGSDRIYCAAMEAGVIVLDAQASEVLWSESFDKPVHRVDAGKQGYCAVLTAGTGDFLTQKMSGAAIYLFDPQRRQLCTFGGNSHYTRDVCVDETNQVAVTVGFKNYHTDGYPVDVPAYQGVNFSGTRVFDGYNYSADELNDNGSNMADARGHRCVIGEDDKLYMVFEVDGGNFVFDNDPFDVMADVKWTSVDKFTASYNTGTDPSLFYGRYDPVTGAYVGGQFFTPRISTGRSNTVRIKNGGLSVDANGTMYLCGVSASGLPLSFDPTGGYSGEAYVLIVKNDFSERLLCGKVGPGSAHSVSVAANGSGAQKVLWCGTARATSGGSLYLRNAPQPDLAGGEDGFFAYIPDSDGETSNTPPVAAFTAGQESGTTLRFDASASRDADGDALSFIWSFNDSDSWSEGRVARHTYPNPIEKTYRMMLTVRDSRGGWDQKELLFGPPRAGFSLSTRAGAAPLEVRFDAGRTTDPNDSLGSLLFDWYLKGSERQRGQAVSRTFTEPGLYKPLLEVRDNMAGYDSHSEYLLVASDESRAFRFDFGTDRNVEKDFTLVGKELYSSQRGYGWARMTDDVKAASWSHDDKIVTDGVQLQKYVKGERFDGEFMVDLPNGVYTVVMHFMQKYDYGFDGVEVEGEKKVAKVYAEGVADGPGLPQVDAFTVEVKDKQMNFVFRRPSGGYAVWFVSGIQIVPGAYDEQAVRSLPMPEIGTSLSRRYVSVRVFDLSGRVIRHSPRLPTATVRTENAVRLFPGLPCGMHVLRWYNESGGCIGSRPFVVTR